MTPADSKIGYCSYMLNIEALLPDGASDPASLLAALLVVGRHRVAIRAALSALADLHNQLREQGAESFARLMAEATTLVLDDRATIDRTVADLVEIGGASVEGWEEMCRGDARKRLETRESSRDLTTLTGSYVANALRAARIDRLEAAAHVLNLTITGPSDAG